MIEAPDTFRRITEDEVLGAFVGAAIGAVAGGGALAIIESDTTAGLTPPPNDRAEHRHLSSSGRDTPTAEWH